MVNKGAGCLIFLENLTILDFSSRINFKSRVEYRTECRCNNTHKKVKKYSLKDFPKLNCDLNSKKSTSRVPECSFCGTLMTEDISETVFSTYRIVSVLMENSFQPKIDLYIDEDILATELRDKRTGDELREGDQIAGVFFLEGVVSMKKESGRYIGTQNLYLLSVNPRKQDPISANRNSKQSSGLKKLSDPL